MSGESVYAEIIKACQTELETLGETRELIQYPEVQADSAWYLSVLEKFNRLESLEKKLGALLDAISAESQLDELAASCSGDGDRALVYGELAECKERQRRLAAALAGELGRPAEKVREYVRLVFKGEAATAAGESFYALLKSFLLSRNIALESEERVKEKGGAVRYDCVFSGGGAADYMRLFAGVHKVYSSSRTESVALASATLSPELRFEESDFKIDLFHSSGAGGQNVNKVETAVRVTHIPTGTVVTCQDERSQLKNKNRAIKTIKERLKKRGEQEEKKRIDADICADLCNFSTPISFDFDGGTMTDGRLPSFKKIAFPTDGERFAAYIDALASSTGRGENGK